MKKEQIMMPEVDLIKEVVVNDKSVKGLEILFQEKIEKTAEANGFNECWWKILGHEEQIFMTLYSISNKKSPLKETLAEMQNYYDTLKDKVNNWIGANLCK